MEYIFTTTRGLTSPPQDHGLVAVIDGQLIKVTPFMAANIPPPMALHEISVPSNALDVVFNDDASIAVLHQDGISVFEYKSPSASGPPPAPKGQIAFEETKSRQNFYQAVVFAPNNEVLVLQRSLSGSIISRYGLNEDSSIIEEMPISSDSVITTLSSFIEDGVAKPFTQNVSGDLCSLLPGSQSVSYGKLTSNLPWVEIASHGDSPIAFGLSASGHLYAGSRVLVKNCTSFLVTPAHLIFTTTNNLIKFVHVTDVNSMSIYFSLINTILTLRRLRSSTGRPRNG